MQKRIINISILTLVSLIFSGCDTPKVSVPDEINVNINAKIDGDIGDIQLPTMIDNKTNDRDNQSEKKYLNSNEIVGKFIDAPVKGLKYNCGQKVGFTDDNGIFKCSNMPIKFFVGEAYLGEAKVLPKDRIITPQDLVGVSRERVADKRVDNIAKLLQSIDKDGNIEKRIDIDKDIADRLSTKVNIQDLDNDSLDALLDRIKAKKISISDTIAHLREHTLAKNDTNNKEITTTKPKAEEPKTIITPKTQPQPKKPDDKEEKSDENKKSLKDKILDLAKKGDNNPEDEDTTLTQTDSDNSSNNDSTNSDDELFTDIDTTDDNTQTQIQNQETRMARMVQENYLVSKLVSKITAESVDSGDWSNPNTWKGGVVPADGARVLINKNHRVVVNKEINTHYRTIKVEGELAFNPHKNTRLYVDTIVTTSGSILRIGEPRHPIDEDKRAEIIISDYNEEGMITNNTKSPDYDPLRIGQGILTNGLFLAHGSYKTPYVTIQDRGVRSGAKEIRVDEEPEGWRVGDSVIILGTSEEGTQSEVRKITSINADVIELDKALEYDHITPDTTIKDVELKVHIANLTRNIIIKTDPAVLDGKGDKNEPSNVEHRGHVLFMHNNNVNINYVQFKDLGRTNKKFPLDETTFTSEAKDAKAKYIGTNQAARYPVHFHRAGLDGKIGRVNGCVVFNSPGWGYVNHSSNVRMVENIAYKVYGASFITEAGDENGLFKANMAIETRGVGKSTVKGWGKRFKVDDGGFQGNGFWILGPYVDFVDNIVNGSSNSAFAFVHTTIDNVTGVIYNDDDSEHSYNSVALKSFVGNVAYANSGGIFGILNGTRSKTTEHISNLLAWNNAPMSNGELIAWWYPDNVTMEGVTLIGDIHNPKYTGIGTQTKLRKTILRDIKIEGLEVGLRIPEYYGPNIVENAYLNNKINMYYRAGTTNKGANTRIQGKIKYGKLPNQAKQVKIKFDLKVRDVSWKNYWNRQFNKFNIVYAPEGETPMKLYLTREQSPDFVVEIGDQKGKSNAQLIREGHRPVGGELTPNNAVKMQGMDNVSGAPVN